MEKLLLGCLYLCFMHSALALTVSDYLCKETQLAQPGRHIVTLVPHAAELLYSVGAGGQIVGAVEYTDFPEAAKKIPQVGNYAGLNIQAIVALQPDVIIYWPEGKPARDIGRLRELKMPLFASDPNT